MTAPAAYAKPLPQPTPLTQPFWNAAKQHRLSLQQCSSCEQYIYYPRAVCPHCGGPHLKWRDVSGNGAVYSYTVARRPTARPFEPDVPYVIAIVELAEGPHLTTNIIGCPPDDVRVGMPVEVTFDDVTEDVTLVKFKPVN